MFSNPARRLPPSTGGRLVLGAALLMLAAGAPRVEAARWSWSGSVTLDYKRILEPPEDEDLLAKTGAVAQWALRANVDVSEKMSFSARLCSSCHGNAFVNEAFAEIRFSPLANVEAGRITVPFGDFYLRHDPANDAFLSKPLPFAMGHMLRYQADQFNLGVVPMPYVDGGVSFFGDVWIREQLQIWYAVYGVNGFSSAGARDFVFKNQVGDAAFEDNNDELSAGTRVALAQGPVSAGVSYMRGAYDPKDRFEYRIWGFDASAYVRGVQLRAEYVTRKTDVFENDELGTLRKKGFYAQAEVPAGRILKVVGRLDGLLREGEPLGTVNDVSSGIVRWTAGVNVAPALDYSFRLQWEHYRFTDFENTDVVRVGVVATY